MQSRFLLDVVVRQRAAVFELLASKDQTLLIRRNAFLVLDLGLDILNGVGALHLEGDGLARQRLNEDLHSLQAKGVREGKKKGDEEKKGCPRA